MGDIGRHEAGRRDGTREDDPLRPSVIAAARKLAERDGMSLSGWILRIAEREIARREGECGACGQKVPAAGSHPDEHNGIL